MTLEETGACVIPFGVGNTKLLLDTIVDLGVTAISCTPSYPRTRAKAALQASSVPSGRLMKCPARSSSKNSR